MPPQYFYPDQLGLIGSALVEATGDVRWRSLKAELIPGGKSNLTFLLSSPAGEVILRRPPLGELLPKAHDMQREARIQRALASTSVPVPVVLFEDAGELIGAPFYVMEKVPGHLIRSELPPGYAQTESARVAIANALVDTLVTLHDIDPSAVGLDDYGHPVGFLERQIGRWRRQWELSKTHEVPAVDELGAQLAKRVPPTQKHSIVHGDYRLDNCVMDFEDPSRINAVLDWELSTLGDPLSDLGMFIFYWREPGEDDLLLTPTVTTMPGFPGRSYLIQRYADRSGANLDAIYFYEAFAHYKFSVIAQGIAFRVSTGAMAGQDFGNVEGEVVRIAEEGLAKLKGLDGGG
ncbi:MAG: phosphotransferase family protein [Actinobacteria bacterium]|jgi:aminoglycoside phosphotransferase (APT) family kinase protein|nr:phosphotransferase family protein [Actinomycetota bacterium]